MSDPFNINGKRFEGEHPAWLGEHEQKLVDACVERGWEFSDLCCERVDPAIVEALRALDGDREGCDGVGPLCPSLMAKTLGRIRQTAGAQRPVVGEDLHPEDDGVEGAELTDAQHDAMFALSNNGYDASRVPAAMSRDAAELAGVLGALEITDAATLREIAGTRESRISAALAGVQAEIERSESRMKLDPVAPAASRSGLRGIRMLDVGGAVAAAVVLLSVGVPVVSAAREKARVAWCGSNLKQVGVAMGQYARDYQGRMPVATAGFGNVWGNVGKPGQSNSENFFVLAREQYTPVASMGCSGNSACMSGLCASSRDYSCLEKIGYSMQVPRAGEVLLLEGERRVVAADRNPMTLRAFRGEMCDPEENSPNHGGRGQQVLDNLGTVVWVTAPRDPATGDNIWLPRSLEQQTRSTGRRWMKPLEGREVPETGDVLLGP
jgi:hypothetical protein